MPTLPNRLHPGDLLGLICPASAPPDPKTVDASVTALEEMGFKVRVGRHARKRWGFLAGQDRERAADVMQMFADRKVKGIVCLRGGYGTPRLLPLLDYGVIRQNPKVFVGFSDITALHCAFLKKANLLSFHGPMTGSHFTKSGPDNPEFTRKSWIKTLTEPVAPGSICAGYGEKTVSVITRGKVSGKLIGGNLTLINCLLGTAYLPSFRNKILFFEEIDEKPYRVDRNLTHLLNAGLLQQVTGVAVGINKDCHDPKAETAGEYRQTLEDVLKDRLGPLKVPVVIGLPFGHVPHNATLPVGAQVTLDANSGDLIITGPAVK